MFHWFPEMQCLPKQFIILIQFKEQNTNEGIFNYGLHDFSENLSSTLMLHNKSFAKWQRICKCYGVWSKRLHSPLIIQMFPLINWKISIRPQYGYGVWYKFKTSQHASIWTVSCRKMNFILAAINYETASYIILLIIIDEILLVFFIKHLRSYDYHV